MSTYRENQNAGVLHVTNLVRCTMREQGVERAAAVKIVADLLRPEAPAALQQAWDEGFGTFAVAEAERYILNHAPVLLLNDSPSDPTQGEKPDVPANFGTSRWDRMDPLRVHVGVGNTGRRVPIGEATKEDLLTMGLWRKTSGATLLRQAQGLLEMSARMEDDETLSTALPKMDQEHKELIEELVHVRFSDVEAELEKATP